MSVSRPQPVEIVGGGLAGLSLGLALRKRGVPVTLFEAGDYPRARVCGEFISGLARETVRALGLEEILADARAHREVAWFHGARELLRHRLPETAWAISRRELDAGLAKAFQEAGGHLVVKARVDVTPREGRVNASGRRRTASEWIGLKRHVRGLELTCGLELHLGREGYVGLCALPGGVVNVCGLFRRQGGVGGRADVLVAHLCAVGLEALAAKVAAADWVEGSEAAVAGIGFGRVEELRGEVSIGDAQRMLPPFFGNGMAAAFQMAEIAIGPVAEWSSGVRDWERACEGVRRQVRRKFRLRATVGNALHALLLSPKRQRLIGHLARLGCVPTGLLYATLH